MRTVCQFLTFTLLLLQVFFRSIGTGCRMLYRSWSPFRQISDFGRSAKIKLTCVVLLLSLRVETEIMRLAEKERKCVKLWSVKKNYVYSFLIKYVKKKKGPLSQQIITPPLILSMMHSMSRPCRAHQQVSSIQKSTYKHQRAHSCSSTLPGVWLTINQRE